MGGDDGIPRETLATNFRMRGQRYDRQVEVKIAMRDPGLAAILSLIIPGIGQFYNGRILAGILWLIITPGLWIGTGGLLGWVAHVVSAYTAYSYARDHRVREAWD